MMNRIVRAVVILAVGNYARKVAVQFAKKVI